MLVLSLYTQLFEVDRKFYLYNAANNFFSKISLLLYNALVDKSWDKLPTDVLNFMKEKRILVEETQKFDYYYSELLRFNTMNYNKAHMGLVIAPTTACNFDCPYCFEPKKSPKTMTDEVMKQIVDFVRTNKHLKEIDITWYGGEPLLAFHKIKELYSQLGKEGMPEIQHQTIITNGYLFTNEVIQFFKDVKLNRIQITLDGVREHHNKTRCLKGEERLPTFDVIISNIKNIVKVIPGIHIDVRVNINKINYNDFVDIYKYFREEVKSPKQIFVYPGIIREDSDDKCSLCATSYNVGELSELYQYFRDQGVDTSVFPHKKQKGCMMHSMNAFIIGPEGEIYKCWNDVSDSDKVIGNIFDDNLSGVSRYVKYMTQTIPFNDECKHCAVFPLCDGGCSHHRYRNLFESGRFVLCSPYKDKEKLKKALFNGEIKIQ